jgi:putative DNA primase/helicase
MPPTPRFFTTASLGYGYRLDAPRPERWLQFLDEILPDDSVSVNLLQEFAGYLLTPDNRHGKILAICGPTRAGKGTFSEVCRHLVGRENTAAPMLHSLAGDFGKQPLLGKTLMVVSDARLSSKTDQASVLETLLRISGNDPITVHRKFLPAVDVVLPCRIIILTNEMPRLYDPSGAIAGRMLFVKLTRSFLGREDKLLKPTLETEIEGILGWAIEGWQRLQQRGYFLEPESSQEMNEEMQDLASPIGRFVREKCSLGEGLQVQRSELYEEWKTWCEEVGDKYPGDDAQFGKMLLAACPTVRTCRPREGDRRPNRWPRGRQV